MIDTALNFRIATFLLFVALAGPSLADVKRVTVDVAEEPVWVGQKATFVVNLRGRGPFVGAASFSLPQIPRTVILKVGNPVVSAEEIEDESWFVQKHEFALFSQTDGVVEIPSFEVRFSNRDGFTGPKQDHVEKISAFQLQMKRPQGSDPDAFLVTAESLSVEEEWEPNPGQAKQGDVFHRTIRQRADQVSGMALAPPSTTVPDGVRIHIDDPEIEDKTERGDFAGSRTDRITYVFEKPGPISLPAVKYVWWKPESEQFASTTLPAESFDIAAIPQKVSDAEVANTRGQWISGLVAFTVLGMLLVWRWSHISHCAETLFNKLNPPQRRTERMLLRACRHNDANAAEAAWTRLQIARSSSDRIDPEIRKAVSDLHRHVYGPTANSPWDGSQLAAALKTSRSARHHHQPTHSDLPPLNPTEVL